jgi:hypothetical protein
MKQTNTNNFTEGSTMKNTESQMEREARERFNRENETESMREAREDQEADEFHEARITRMTRYITNFHYHKNCLEDGDCNCCGVSARDEVVQKVDLYKQYNYHLKKQGRVQLCCDCQKRFEAAMLRNQLKDAKELLRIHS